MSIPLRRLLQRPVAPTSAGSLRPAAQTRSEILLEHPAAAGRAALLTREVTWLRLRGDDGAQGIGEASAVDWLSQRSAAATRRELADLAAQIVATRPLASELLERSFDVSLSSTARAGLQCALLDLEARRRGVSLARLLGATSDATLAVSALLSGDPALATEEAARYRSQGFGSVKLKVGAAGAGDDIARILDVRAAAGPQMRLRLDANGAWNEVDAESVMRGVGDAGIDFVEEPLADDSPHRLALMRALRAHAPIAVDESIPCSRDLDAVIAAGAADVLVLKLERVGGPLPALALAEIARREGLRVVFTDSIESGVGRAATSHVAHAAGSGEALGLGGAFFLDSAPLCTTEAMMDDAGRAAAVADAPQAPIRPATQAPAPFFVIRGPGLGVELPEREH